LAITTVVAVGGVFFFTMGPQRPTVYDIARANIAEARFFMKYAHTDTFCVQFAVGMREEPYTQDGRAATPVDFAIVNVEIHGTTNPLREMEQLEGTIRIGNEQYPIVLLRNPYDSLNFTNDIIRSLRVPATMTDAIEVTLFIANNNHPTIALENAFNDEAIAWDEALRTATDKIGYRVKNKQFETHVTIMHNVAHSGAFWYVRFITQDGEIHFTVIAPDGAIIG